MTKLSIIVASYNSGKTIQKALESILMQTFQEWECIIVDGVSMDNTLEIIKQYVLKDNRFRYVSEPDNGIYDAFNKGWMMAKGEWIHYLGSDDYLLVTWFISYSNWSSSASFFRNFHCGRNKCLHQF